MEGLIALAQRNIIEFHTWNSTSRALETPDRIILDLDPGPDVKWREVVEAARKLRTLLQDLKLESWVKTTGGKGLHVVIPIVPQRNWSVCLDFAKTVAASLVEHDPERYTLTFSKRDRADKSVHRDDNQHPHAAGAAQACFDQTALGGAEISLCHRLLLSLRCASRARCA